MQIFRFFLFCFLFGQLAIAQQEGQSVIWDDSNLEKQSISEKDLETYKNDDDFNYVEVKKEESILDKAYRWLQNILRKFWEAIFGVDTAQGFLYFMFRILPYILLGVLIYLLIRFFPQGQFQQTYYQKLKNKAVFQLLRRSKLLNMKIFRL